MRWVLILCIMLSCILFFKLCMIKKSLREMKEQLADRASLDSNSQIRISSGDRDLRAFANEINVSLKRMTEVYHRYNQGDAEMRAAVTNIAHDIRTPLTSICGYLSLMDRLEKSEDMERYLEIIQDRAFFMKKLTEELFDYSLINGNDEPAPMEMVSVNKVLEDSIMNYYAAITEKGIEPVVNITETRILRMINVPHLERVFSNLISNALKYSDGDLEISMDDTGRITFSNSARELSNVQLERLFHRFYTVQTARNSTGLGLAIAKKYVEEMSGVIAARYENGRLFIDVEFPKTS